MTQKPFGVKQLNVIGAAGTPTIESAGDLNIGGQQVAITTNTSISGVITATAFSGGDDDKINLGDNDDLKIWHAANGTGIIQNAGSGQLQLRSDEIRLLNQATDEDYAFFKDDGAVELYCDNTKRFETTLSGAIVTGILTATSFSGDGANITGISTSNITNYSGGGGGGGIALTDLSVSTASAGTAALSYNNSNGVFSYTPPDLSGFAANTNVSNWDTAYGWGNHASAGYLTSVNQNFSGIVTATSFQGNTTTGDGSDRGFTTKYYITSSGASAYRFAGPGVLNSTNNPTLYFHRGFTYILENSTGGSHPFALRVTSGGSSYSPGGSFLTGSTTGTQILTVPFDGPSSIVYQCTLHGGMLGTINFVS